MKDKMSNIEYCTLPVGKYAYAETSSTHNTHEHEKEQIHIKYKMYADMIWYMIWHGMIIWYDAAWDGIWYDMIWYSVICDMIWCGKIWYGIWYECMIWYGIWYMVWYDMIWYVWYDMNTHRKTCSEVHDGRRILPVKIIPFQTTTRDVHTHARYMHIMMIYIHTYTHIDIKLVIYCNATYLC